MGRIIRMGEHLLFLLTDFIVQCARPGAPTGDVLVVRVDAIGDFVLWLDAAQALRALYPGRRLVLCANAALAELARALPYWDEVWPVDMARFDHSAAYRFHVLRKVRAAGFDIAVQPTYSRVYLHGDALVRASGAAQRVGSSGHPQSSHPLLRALANRWYTKLLLASDTPLMELERNAEWVRALGLSNFQPGLPALPCLAQLPERLRIAQPYCIIFPGASWSGRQWPAEHFALVASQLQREYGWLPVICGGPSEARLCDRVARLCTGPARSLGGQTGLVELVELVRGARFLVSNETSAVHVAVATSTPCLCILGGGHYGRFLPYPPLLTQGTQLIANKDMDCYHCNWACVKRFEAGAAMPCIGEISVAQVLASISAYVRAKTSISTPT